MFGAGALTASLEKTGLFCPGVIATGLVRDGLGSSKAFLVSTAR